MILTHSQLTWLSKQIDKASPKHTRGRPRRHTTEDILPGVLWVLKTGARWSDLPKYYPPYQTCHRRFQEWCLEGVFQVAMTQLVQMLSTQYSLKEGSMDATFIKAKKGVTKWDAVKWGRVPKSWPSQIIEVFHSPLLWKTVLHTNQSWWQAYLRVQAKSRPTS